MRIRAVVLMVVLVLLPTATAYSQPAVYYLRDDELGPVVEGELAATPPDATDPSVRAVPVGATQLVPVRFQMNSTDHPPRIIGPVYVAIWAGPSPVLQGNLTASLVAFDENETRILAAASLVLDANTSHLPDPTQIVPPTPEVPPSDPQAYAMYLAFFVLGQVLPAVQPPPRLLFLGVLDEEIAADERLALDFNLTVGSSPLPLPAGAFATIEYDAATTPSLVYVPWYSDDPAVTSTWQPMPPNRPTRPASSNGGPSPSGSASVDLNEGGGTPGLEFVVLAFAIGAVALARRRR